MSKIVIGILVCVGLWLALLALTMKAGKSIKEEDKEPNYSDEDQAEKIP